VPDAEWCELQLSGDEFTTLDDRFGHIAVRDHSIKVGR
jgi:hypothetical protein